jgi:RHS repeat-associated protein
LAGFTWSYDTVNRVTSVTSTLYPAESATYAYDDAGQLTGADYGAGAGLPTAPPDEYYAYDANGNRSSYTTAVDNRLQSDGVYNYTYDNEGNRTGRTKIADGSYTDYAWDYRNRLTSVTDKTAAGAITRQTLYTYDVFDRRVAKQVDWDGSGPQAPRKEYFIYDGQDIALSFVDPDGPGVQAPSLQHRYLHGPAVDQILADEVVTSLSTPGNVLWPLTDNLGTVREVVDFNESTSVAQVVNHLTYDCFGRITSETNAAVDFLFAYTGRERDEESGLYYYRARYYDPATGRFLSQDPIGFEAGDRNLYRYVGNDATNATDPSGLEQPKKDLIVPLPILELDHLRSISCPEPGEAEIPRSRLIRYAVRRGEFQLQSYGTIRRKNESGLDYIAPGLGVRLHLTYALAEPKGVKKYAFGVSQKLLQPSKSLPSEQSSPYYKIYDQLARDPRFAMVPGHYTFAANLDELVEFPGVGGRKGHYGEGDRSLPGSVCAEALLTYALPNVGAYDIEYIFGVKQIDPEPPAGDSGWLDAMKVHYLVRRDGVSLHIPLREEGFRPITEDNRTVGYQAINAPDLGRTMFWNLDLLEKAKRLR